MRKIIISFIFIHFMIVAIGQKQLIKYVQQTTVSIPTIEPDSLNFSDLEIIGKAIGNSRIVMLGEQDHGDAPVFLAKTRLIKYLHEKKGFNVLAFESDFFGLTYGWDKLDKKKNDIDSFLQKNIFPMWTLCNTCSNLFYEYIPGTFNTATPLTITGFDNQMILEYSSKNLTTKLDSVFRYLSLPITKNPNYTSAVLPTIDSLRSGYFTPTKPDDFYARCGNYLAEIKQQAAEKLTHDDFWMMIINNLIQENIKYRAHDKDYFLENNARDSQMAQNLQWLAKHRFQDEKIIVWAANGHIAKYADQSIINGKKKEFITMGSFFTRTSFFLKESYIIGFTSYKGEAGRLDWKGNYTVPEPQPDGFENWIDKSYEYAFVDFRNFTGKHEGFYLKGRGHEGLLKKDWTTIFDGIFYIKTMYPCRK
jgi:erythromycin esterase